MDELFANSPAEELALWQDLIQCEGWLMFKKLVKKHRISLNNDVLIKLRQGKIDEAQDSRSAYDELNKLFNLVLNRIEELKKQQEEA